MYKIYFIQLLLRWPWIFHKIYKFLEDRQSVILMYLLENSLIVQNSQSYFCNSNNILFYHLYTYYLINSIVIEGIWKLKTPTSNRQINIPHKKNINYNRVFWTRKY